MIKHITPNRVVLALVAAAAVMIIWDKLNPGKGGADNQAVREIAHTAIIRYAKENAAMCRGLAKSLRARRVSQDSEIGEWFTKYRDEAVERAFRELNETVEKSLPRDGRTGELDADKAADFFEAQAAGFEEIR